MTQLRANTDDWQPWPGYVPPDAQGGTSRARCERGRGNALPALLTAADRVYVAQHLGRIAHLEARLTERENTVSDLADENARLRRTLERIANREIQHPWNVARIALGMGCGHPRRDYNFGWYTCTECGADKYQSERGVA